MVRNVIAGVVLALGPVLALLDPPQQAQRARQDLARICERVERGDAVVGIADGMTDEIRMYVEAPWGGNESSGPCQPTGCSTTCGGNTCSTGCRPGFKAVCDCIGGDQPVCTCVTCAP